MTFDELKKKAEEIFGRTLSDKEVAEVAINNLSECEEGVSDLEDEVVRLKGDVVQLRRELSEQMIYDEPVRLVADKLQNIMSTKAKEYIFEIKLSKDKAPTINYYVGDEPLVYEEDYE